MAEENRIFGTGKELVEFMDTYDSLLHLTEAEADILLGYMEGHGYFLEGRGGKLFRTDLCTGPENPESTEYTIDEAIEAACDWNYGLTLGQEDGPGQEAYLRQLKADGQVLEGLFDRTAYGWRAAEAGWELAWAAMGKPGQGLDIKAAGGQVAGGVREGKGAAR